VKFLVLVSEGSRVHIANEWSDFSSAFESFLSLVDDYKLDEKWDVHSPINREARNDEQGLSAYLLEVT
jgi:hypothetical protein